MRDAAGQEAAIAFHAQQHGLVERTREPPHGFVSIAAMRNQLGQHGVVVGRYFQAARECVVDTHIRWRTPQGDPAALRHEAIVRIFRAKAYLDRVAATGEPLVDCVL